VVTDGTPTAIPGDSTCWFVFRSTTPDGDKRLVVNSCTPRTQMYVRIS
ncbi:MAG: hypothetical protein QOC57_1745, partial [Ilumatobacteraceae bacterium]